MLIVSFPYNGEPVALLHIEYLYDWVDMFIIVEARWTHSGLKKPYLYFYKNYRSFLPYAKKIHFILIDSFPSIPKENVLYQDFLYNKDPPNGIPPYDSYVGKRDNNGTEKTCMHVCIIDSNKIFDDIYIHTCSIRGVV